MSANKHFSVITLDEEGDNAANAAFSLPRWHADLRLF